MANNDKFMTSFNKFFNVLGVCFIIYLFLSAIDRHSHPDQYKKINYVGYRRK